MKKAAKKITGSRIGSHRRKLKAMQDELGLTQDELAKRIFHDRSTIIDVATGKASTMSARKILGLVSLVLEKERLLRTVGVSNQGRFVGLVDSLGRQTGSQFWTHCPHPAACAFRLDEPHLSFWYPPGSVLVAYPVDDPTESALYLVQLRGSHQNVLKRVYIAPRLALSLRGVVDSEDRMQVLRKDVQRLLKVWSMDIRFEQQTVMEVTRS